MEPKEKVLKRSTRYLMFVLICLINSYCGLSGSVLSSFSQTIKKELNISDTQFGSFGSILGMGNVFGSLVYSLISGSISRKFLFIFSIGFYSLSHLIFVITTNYKLIIAIRFLSGTSQVIGYCYFPCWVDQFAIFKHKETMMTILNLSGNLGMIWGYLLGIFFDDSNWKFSFICELVAMYICLISLIFIPGEFFNNKYFNKKNDNDNNREQDSIFMMIKIKKDEVEKSDEKTNNIKKPAFLIYLTNPEFILMLLFKANFFFICIAELFWYGDHLVEVYNCNDNTQKFYSYTLSLVISSIIGGMLSGIVTSFLGGSSSKKGMISLLICHGISIIIGIITPYQKNIKLFTVFNSLFSLFNSWSGNFAINMAIVSLPNELKGNAIGFFMFCMQWMAFFPGPIVFACIKSYYSSSIIALKFLFFYGIIGFICFLMYTILRLNKITKENKDEKNIPLKDMTE